VPQTQAETTTKNSQQAPRLLSSRRKWCFRVLAVSLPFVALVILEVVLRWAGVGEDLRLVQPAGEGAPAEMYRFNRHTDQAYYGATDLSGPEPRPFVLPRPEGTFRIVVIGGSTVAGFPYPSELAFPRLLEILLRAQQPGREVEVLNAGITAINSFSEADLVKQSLASQPDLIIVYTGHNEFVGPGGVGSTSGGFSPRLSPALYALRRTRTFQTIAGWLRPRGGDDRELLDQLPGDLKIALDGSKFRRAEDCFHSNIRRMAHIAETARIPILLTTPITNLRHQRPMQALFRDGLTSGDRAAWQQFFQKGEELRAAGEFTEALEVFERARAIDAGHALLEFRRAECFEGLDRWDDARVSYQAASDLDACRFRAPASFARIIEECSAAAHSGNVHFLDTSASFAPGAPHGIPGSESFLEHVHFTYDGNWRMAAILAEYVARNILGLSWHTELVPDDRERDRLCGVIPQDHLAALSLILIMLERPPLNQAADVGEQVDAIRLDLRRHFAELAPAERELFADLSIERLQSDLIGALFARYALSEMDAEAGALLRRTVIRQPWRTELVLSLAEWEFRQGNPAKAIRLLDQARHWKPDSPRAARLREQLSGPSD
jgi:lysophospholipase L1-like esterase